MLYNFLVEGCASAKIKEEVACTILPSISASGQVFERKNYSRAHPSRPDRGNAEGEKSFTINPKEMIINS